MLPVPATALDGQDVRHKYPQEEQQEVPCSMPYSSSHSWNPAMAEASAGGSPCSSVSPDRSPSQLATWIGYGPTNRVVYVFESCGQSSKVEEEAEIERLARHASVVLSGKDVQGQPPLMQPTTVEHWQWSPPSSGVDTYSLVQRQCFQLIPPDKAADSKLSGDNVQNAELLCLLCKIRLLGLPLFIEHCEVVHALQMSSEHQNVLKKFNHAALLLSADLPNGVLYAMKEVPWQTEDVDDEESEDNEVEEEEGDEDEGEMPDDSPVLPTGAMPKFGLGVANGQPVTLAPPPADVGCEYLAAAPTVPSHPEQATTCQPIPTTALMSQSRNSAKTLKCPKCNWHYKYQETLEIHMKEKHSDGEVSCLYCLSNQPHPRLARGENYLCGFKPYRCDICRYSTTTKGNLAIHMQSDKHLNNVQELHQAQLMLGMESDTSSSQRAAMACLVTGTSPSGAPGAPVIEESWKIEAGKRAAVFRCDLCNYETNIARNLRIHMTSEKHSQNCILARRTVKHQQCNGLPLALDDSSGSASSTKYPQLTPPAWAMSNSVDEDADSADLEDEDVEEAKQSADQDGQPEASSSTHVGLFQCCICLDFTCDSLEEVMQHANADRSKPNDTDFSIINGNYMCNLCHYKTHLKANFTLHIKTEKHLQRLQLMNHIQEGSMQKEWRLQFLKHNSPVQLRCVACNEFCDNLYKLQAHVTCARHKCCLQALDKVRKASDQSVNGRPSDSPRRILRCLLCHFVAVNRKRMFDHLLSAEHAEAVNEIWAVMEINAAYSGLKRLESGGESVMPDWIEEGVAGIDYATECAADAPDCVDQKAPSSDRYVSCDSIVAAGAIVTPCNSSTSADALSDTMTETEHSIDRTSSKFPAGVLMRSGQDVATGRYNGLVNKDVSKTCPLCQKELISQTVMEEHLLTLHNVTSEGMYRLLQLLPSDDRITFQMSPTGQSNAGTNSARSAGSVPEDEEKREDSEKDQTVQCPCCFEAFSELHLLYAHQEDTGHVEQRISSSGDVEYRCWFIKCNIYFSSLTSLKAHFDSVHTGSSDNMGQGANPLLCGDNRPSSANGHSSDPWIRRVQSNSLDAQIASEDRLDLTHSSESAPEDVMDEMPSGFAANNEDKLNSNEAALEAYRRGHRRPYRCHRCKMAFTKQVYLTVHNRGVVHRQRDKTTPSLDKYYSSNRPYKCEICHESFTQKSILLVHFNSVSHLYKLKRLLINSSCSPGIQNISQATLIALSKCDPSTLLATSPAVLESLVSSVTNGTGDLAAYSQRFRLAQTGDNEDRAQSKRFRCNLCHLSYNSRQNLSVHLRSVAHQAKLGRYVFSKQTFGDSSYDGGSPSAAPKQSSERGMSSSSSDQEMESTNIDDVMQQVAFGGATNSLCRTSWKSVLEEYGFELMMQYNESVCRRSRLSDDPYLEPPEAKRDRSSNGYWIKQIAPGSNPELLRCSCAFCDEEFSGVLILKAHVEICHREMVPEEEVERVVVAFRKAYDKKHALEQKRQGSPLPRDFMEVVSEGGDGRKKGALEHANGNPHSASQVDSIAVDSVNSNAAAAAAAAAARLFCASAANVGFGFGIPLGMLGMPFGPYSLANPYVASMAPSLPLNSSMAHSIEMMTASGPIVSRAGSSRSSSANLFAPPLQQQQHHQQQQQQQQQKRARTRITDDQLKILREYFDINNSPSEEQVEEMSKKSGLPQKVIKHWFRNTLFKERQRSKDSPYNFSIPPSYGIDLEEYEKTGEAKVIPLNLDVTGGGPQPTTQGESSKPPAEPELLEGEPKATASMEMSHGSEATRSPIASVCGASSPVESGKEEMSSVSSQSSSLVDGGRRRSVDTLPDLSTVPVAAMDTLSNFNMLFGRQDSFSKAFAPLHALPCHIRGSGAFFPSAPCLTPLPGAGGGLMGQLPSAGSQFSAGSGCGSSRRANRTRFTEQQVKVLQEFFERNAYPKDDDLELLSKKLNLSPRVIVVWFQNARQKARKIYENQPADSEERFSRTPGLNYECKSCRLVFLRYYELIKHHKAGCTRSPGKGYEKRSTSLRQDVSLEDDGQQTCAVCSAVFGDHDQLERHISDAHGWSQSERDESRAPSEESYRRHRTKLSPENVDKLLAYYCIDANPSGDMMQQIADEIGVSKRVVQVWYQNTRARERRAQGTLKTDRCFNKRCPFCGILFHSKEVMTAHFIERHAQQYQATEVNIDSLPDAEEVPTISTLPISQTYGTGTNSSSQTDSDVLEMSGEDSPLDLSRSAKFSSRYMESQTGGHSSHDLRSLQQGAGQEVNRRRDELTDDDQQNRGYSPSPSSQQRLLAALARPQKRFRTHLTPSQVKVMRYLFQDYKTPTMSECETLGAEIGLHKRVVQVWFQNARAKERKAIFIGATTGRSDSTTRPESAASSTHCALCNVVYSRGQMIQDHVFTKKHIDKVKSTVGERPNSSTAEPSAAAMFSNEPAAAPLDDLHSPGKAAAKRSESCCDGQSAPEVPICSSVTQNLLPYVYPAGVMPVAYYSGLTAPMMYPNGFTGFLPNGLLYDPNISGTPVSMLQVPQVVREMIMTAMKNGRSSNVRFSQDGKSLDDLVKSIGAKDRQALSSCDLEVGWSCRQCVTVFQSEQQFENHRRLFCRSVEAAFKLIQTHYECRLCATRYGLQAEFVEHCASAEHMQKLQ